MTVIPTTQVLTVLIAVQAVHHTVVPDNTVPVQAVLLQLPLLALHGLRK